MYGLIDYAHRRCLNRICIYIRIFVCANLTRKKIESFDETNILTKANRLILNNRRKRRERRRGKKKQSFIHP